VIIGGHVVRHFRFRDDRDCGWLDGAGRRRRGRRRRRDGCGRWRGRRSGLESVKIAAGDGLLIKLGLFGGIVLLPTVLGLGWNEV
jgi:hypothetical protein